ncbi:MAG: ArsR family transcriptional regulator [Methanoregulaceae archaeon]|jgi:flavodoxin|nr:ArsR family transcriptional regulator [Methanoregulaceae archaeon]MCU0628819.1 ArsR family transcriptional regulator [Methanoregulaceae archaeon]
MKISIIYHSYSGITRGIAERIQAACGGDLIEVKPRNPYSKITAYTTGSMRARREEADPVDPREIDLASSNLIVIGTPVWFWKTTPVTNGAIRAMKNCQGKKAVVFATCGSKAGEAIPIMKRGLQEKGVTVVGEYVLTQKDVSDEQKVAGLVNAVKAAGNAS